MPNEIIIEQAKSLQQDIVKWRRELHQIPETGDCLPKTCTYIERELKNSDIEYTIFKGFSGISAFIKGKNINNVIALRADMDALPIKEKTNLAYASKNKNMHACGHDAHMAMLLGAAKILSQNRSKFEGSVKFIFQSSEENGQGAKKMIENGVLDNPPVSAIVALHIGSIFPEIRNGQIGYCKATMMASYDRFILKIIGKSCHGARPEKGIDPIPIAANIINSLQTIVSRTIKPSHSAVVTIGKIIGGTQYNIISDQVKIEGTIRAIDEGDRNIIIDRIDKIANGIAKGMGASCKLQYIKGAPTLRNDPIFTEYAIKSIQNIVAKENIIEIKEPTMIGEDFSYYLNKVAGTYLILGSYSKNKNNPFDHHSPFFDISEDVLWIGTAVLSKIAFDYSLVNVNFPPSAEV